MLAPCLSRRALLAAAPALAATARPAPALAVDCDERERTWFTNTTLLDQDGRTVRFYDDVLRDRTVLVGWIFTNCQDACPLLAARSLAIVDGAAGRAAAPPRIVHLTTDPRRDQPAALKAWAARFGTYPDWVLLTGAPRELREVSRRLGQTVDAARPDLHSTLLIGGNVAARRWAKLRPELPPEAIAVQLADLAAAAPVASAAGCSG